MGRRTGRGIGRLKATESLPRVVELFDQADPCAIATPQLFPGCPERLGNTPQQVLRVCRENGASERESRWSSQQGTYLPRSAEDGSKGGAPRAALCMRWV